MKGKNKPKAETLRAVDCSVIVHLDNGEKRILNMSPEQQRHIWQTICAIHDDGFEVSQQQIEYLLIDKVENNSKII